ncbi:hypothetical protein [Longimycelium tulufanense]|uniref:hypothetical protein n=1 Tax=Longimycelium tulufanense TaxID=907463 RepID=UPI00166352DA|nr:hypothetical protein [Longimycelium tulufanense]
MGAEPIVSEPVLVTVVPEFVVDGEQRVGGGSLEESGAGGILTFVVGGPEGVLRPAGVLLGKLAMTAALMWCHLTRVADR